MKYYLLALSASVAMMGNATASEWGYSGKHNPENWGEVSETCQAGNNQSPIDINQAVKASIKPLEIHYNGTVLGIVNNGHTIQAKVAGDNTLTVDGKTFKLAQFHFHTPSENYINNHQFAMEAHFVNQDKDGNLAVIAVMFDKGQKSQFMDKLTANLPKTGHSEKFAHPLKVKDLLPDSTQTYYRFNGSLTTPPCSEGVRWFVLKDTKTLSGSQQQAMMGVMGHNNRPLQPLNARLVTSN
ncbi:Carbonic anhydrase precursor [Vibrio aerogenes CECT 7868]|uniref:Carbonic anhydrase n=1 Tax=Vibrio aerogenes CECT 7868 TaxID=1216006 RepID=A0A1M5XZ74_9VIBR|nr:carbonic anhydrase family protein [Vibrio aerogenes]SHI05016.1 Carbonic anhydrase precursor [Vibrio aerogenes CECT 7868]